jgi:zinc protease
VLFVETHDLPIVDVAVDFPAGSARDAPAKPGVAAMTLRLMRMGADGIGEDEISSRLADVGAEMSSRFDPDRAGFSIRTLSGLREREQALRVLESAGRPTFPQGIIEAQQRRHCGGDTAGSPPTGVRAVVGHPYAMRGSAKPIRWRLDSMGPDDFYRASSPAGQWFRSSGT